MLKGKGKNDTDAAGAASVVPDVAAADGDYCLLWVISDNSTSGAPTWPGGFAEDSLSPLTVTVDGGRLRWASKIASGEPGSWSISVPTAPCIRGCAIFADRDQTTPVHRISALADNTNRASEWTGTSSAFATNTTLNGCDLLYLMYDDVTISGNVNHTAPPGFTKQVEHNPSTFFNGCLSVLENWPSGETGVYAGKGLLAGSNAGLGLVVIALAPAIPPEDEYPTLAPRRSTRAPLSRRSA